ncbi:MAG: hypothetical protein O7J95_03120 [Planctomycetota bacterium]|nr:hypothetical protein [Planctomycetota bacterium]
MDPRIATSPRRPLRGYPGLLTAHLLRRSPVRRPGYTLVEVLVVTGILVILGSGLVALLNQALGLWRRAETRGKVYEQARAVLDTLARDLRSTVIRAHATDGDTSVRFLCDRDPRGRQRLRFVRVISGEASHPVLRLGGRYVSPRAPAVYDGRRDALEAREGRLAAPGGRMEVLYALDPREGERWLWRGVRSPVGGDGSLFDDRRLDGESAGPGRRRQTRGGAKESADDPPLARVARPVSDGVLFLGFGFWGPTTNTWEPLAMPRREVGRGQKSGPLFFWDSTRALLDQKGEADEFVFRRRSGSLRDPSDDIYPEMVEVTLVLREDDSPLGVRLGEPVAADTKKFRISRPLRLSEDPRDRFIRVGEEWIAVEKIEDRTVTVADGGRGVRDTQPRRHEAGAPVERGLTFRRVVRIPAHRRVREPAADVGGERRRGKKRRTR